MTADVRPPDRSRGASGWRLDIYSALWEAADEGYHCAECPGQEKDPHEGCLSSDELQQQCERRFNMSGTIQWYRWILSKTSTTSIISTDDVDFPAAVAAKLKATRNSMRAAHEVRNLGTTRRCVWTLGERAPRYWHPKSVVKGHFREYLHPRADTEARRYARKMNGGWPTEVRTELARTKPRPARMRELLAEALELYAS